MEQVLFQYFRTEEFCLVDPLQKIVVSRNRLVHPPASPVTGSSKQGLPGHLRLPFHLAHEHRAPAALTPPPIASAPRSLNLPIIKIRSAPRSPHAGLPAGSRDGWALDTNGLDARIASPTSPKPHPRCPRPAIGVESGEVVYDADQAYPCFVFP